MHCMYRDPKCFYWSGIQVWRDVARLNRYGSYTGITNYNYTIKTQDGQKVELASPLEVQQVGELICNEVTKRHFPQARQAYNAGKILRFGPLSLSRQGLGHGFSALDWTDVASVTPQEGYIIIMSRQSQRQWAKVAFAEIPNGFVFLALISEIGKSSGQR